MTEKERDERAASGEADRDTRAADQLTENAAAIESALLEGDRKRQRSDRLRNRLIGAVAIGVALLVINAGYSQWRAIFRTGPSIANTENIAETLNNTNADVQTLVHFVEAIVESTCEVPTERNADFCRGFSTTTTTAPPAEEGDP